MSDVASRLQALEERVRVLEDLDDRVDSHDKELEAIRTELRGLKREVALVRSDISRLADASTSQGLVLQKVHSLLEQLVRQLTPSVEVK